MILRLMKVLAFLFLCYFCLKRELKREELFQKVAGDESFHDAFETAYLNGNLFI